MRTAASLWTNVSIASGADSPSLTVPRTAQSRSVTTWCTRAADGHVEPREVVDDEQLRLTAVVVLQALPEGGEQRQGRLRVGVRREQRHQRTERDGRRRPRGDDAVSGPAALLDLRRGGRREPRLPDADRAGHDDRCAATPVARRPAPAARRARSAAIPPHRESERNRAANEKSLLRWSSSPVVEHQASH